jgi:hypothetical protein
MGNNKKQIGMFETSNELWEDHWVDMPEFMQEDLSPFKEINIKLRNREDMELFMEIVGQEFTMKTKSIWFPKLEIKKVAHLRYIDES